MHSTDTNTDTDTAAVAYVEQLVAEEGTRQAQEAEAKRAADAVDEAQACDLRVAALRAEVEPLFDPRLRTALHLTFEAPSSRVHPAQAHLEYHGTWTLQLDYQNLTLTDPAGNYAARLMHGVPAAANTRALLAAFAAFDERVATAERVGREHEQAWQKCKAEQAAVVAAARAEHEACQAEFEAKRAEANATQWQWPAGRSITVFHWTWQSGHTEDGEPVHSSGWSRPTDLLDPLHLQATRHHGERRLHLREEAHLPVAEEHTFASIGELPDELTTRTTINVPGIAYGYSHVLDEMAYSRTASGDEEPDSPGAAITLAPLPMPWIRELVESRFTSRQPHPFEEEMPF